MQITETTSNPNRNEGFKTLKVKASSSSNVVRHIFIKKFWMPFAQNNTNQGDPESAENRTLFLINIPPWITENHLRHLFEKRCGKILSIFFEDKASMATSIKALSKIQNVQEASGSKIANYFTKASQSSFKVSYIVFNKVAGLQNALDLAEEDNVYCLKPDQMDQDQQLCFLTGVALWQKQYNDSLIAPWKAKRDIESFLSDYKQAKVEEEETSKMIAESEDTDGWTTVNRNLRRNRTALRNNQYQDEQIRGKYADRANKRLAEESKFDEKIDKSLEQFGMKKKKKAKFINKLDMDEF